MYMETHNSMPLMCKLEDLQTVPGAGIYVPRLTVAVLILSLQYDSS